MALFNVINLFDSGLGSLRQAILDANAMAGADTIQFSSVTGTIPLTSGQLSITDSLAINGPGANNLSVSGNNLSRVFYLNNPSATIDVFIDGLTITGGGGNTLSLGGGIRNQGDENLTLSNSTISSNMRNGVTNFDGTMTISNSTISNNTLSYYSGGGVRNGGGTVTISNSTVSGNTARNNGGGVANYGTLNLANTIIANSPNGGDCVNSGTISTNINNLIEDGSCNPLLSGDPNLGPLRNKGGPTFTQALLPESIAIDAGSNTAIPPGITTDQRGPGFPRIINGTVDIGAYEASQGVPSIPEPSSLFDVLTLGLLAIGLVRRRRK